MDGVNSIIAIVMTNTSTLASIQPILSVEKHPNADALDIVQVKGYKAIVKRNQWKVGDLAVWIEPDSVLPDGPTWAAFYKAKSSRVKAVKLRGAWSFGIVESVANVGYTGPMEIGLDITSVLGITKYIAPEPQDLNASGPYGFGIPKTDEHRWQSLDGQDLPFGQLVDVTLKVDGQSWTAFVKLNEDGTVERGVGGRSFLYKLDSNNNYTRNEQRYDVLNKLEAFCRANKVSLALRGESYGVGIQKGNNNPHSKMENGLALFSTWLIDERRYANKGHPYYIHNLAPQLGLPTVSMLERDVLLTKDLVFKYDEGMTKLSDGNPFEGVVIQHAAGSFKVINKAYDASK